MRTEAQKRAYIKYNHSKKGKARNKKYCRNHGKELVAFSIKYQQSEKGKKKAVKTTKRYECSEKGRATRKNYNCSEEGKISQKKYNQTEKGKINKIKKQSKRRDLGFIKIHDNIFPKNVHIHWHHIDDEHVIALPRDVHRKCFTGETVRHRELCSQAIECLYGKI